MGGKKATFFLRKPVNLMVTLPRCRRRAVHDKQCTAICSGRAIYFKWYFCLLSKSTLVTWINPLHPHSIPSYKYTWTVCSAGVCWPLGTDLHTLYSMTLNSYKGKTECRLSENPSLPFQTKGATCVSLPWTKHSWATWPAQSCSSQNGWDRLQPASQAIVKQSLTPRISHLLLRAAGEHFYTHRKNDMQKSTKIINHTFKVCSYFIYKYTFNTKKHWYPSLVNSSVTIRIILMIILTNKLHWKINASKILGHNIKKYNI